MCDFKCLIEWEGQSYARAVCCGPMSGCPSVRPSVLKSVIYQKQL